nr:hypothetical protein [uncultured Cohaesibacter sp.]
MTLASFLIYWMVFGLICFSLIIVIEKTRPTVYHAIAGAAVWPLLLFGYFLDKYYGDGE